jgi:phosphate starvation-inducible PhoH-like protein
VRGILDDVEDIHFAELTSSDVVRHRLVSAIVDAYERDEATRADPARDPARGSGPSVSSSYPRAGRR